MPDPVQVNAPPNQVIPLLWFFVVTTIYFFLKVNTSDPMEKKVYIGIYLLLVIIGEYFINLSLTETMCGIKQWQTALNVTVMPWFLIFGVLNMFLVLFPDWLSPFSNTFGYGIAKLMGLGDFFESILQPEIDVTGDKSLSPETKAMAEALEHIYSDKSLLLNEIKNVDTFWSRMQYIIKPDMYKDVKLKERLQYFVNIKNSVAEYVWFVLAGSLVNSITYNYIVTMTCSQSLNDLQLKAKNLQSLQGTSAAEVAAPRLYSSTE